MHVLIVGAGIAGLSSAWALARAGHRVTLFDRYDAPNPLGSSVDRHRLIRLAYGAEAGYARMARDAYGAWDRMFADLGGPLGRYYRRTGTLVVSSADGDDWLSRSAATLEAMGEPIERLGQGELAARFPHIDAAGVAAAFHLNTGGMLYADAIVAALAARAVERGVDLRMRTQVVAVDLERGAATLADGTRVAGDAVIVAAGPWVPKLLPDVAGRLTPSRQVVLYVDPPAATRAAWDASPMVLDIDADGFYAVPPAAPGEPFKIGDHRFTLRGDPDRDREPTAEEAAALFEFCRRRIRGSDEAHVAGAKTCFYTAAADERFALEKLGAAGWLMSCCSGHGFKFGALLGEAVAAGLTGAIPADELSRWAAGLAPERAAPTLEPASA